MARLSAAVRHLIAVQERMMPQATMGPEFRMVAS